MEALSRSNPVLMIFEDVHWIDPTSLEALGRTVERLRTLAGVADRYVPTRVRAAVDRTASRHCAHHQPARGARNRCDDRPRHGNKSLPANIRQDIIERTDGIPLFVEEMTKAVLEAENRGDARTTAAAVPSPASGGACEPARFADGAARPAGSCERSGADRSGDRARVLASRYWLQWRARMRSGLQSALDR